MSRSSAVAGNCTQRREHERGEAMSLRKTIDGWLEDGETVVGVFCNHDLSSSQVGHCIGISFESTDTDKLIVGESRAPDHPAIGLGWRYILQLVSTDTNEICKALEGDPLQ